MGGDDEDDGFRRQKDYSLPKLTAQEALALDVRSAKAFGTSRPSPEQLIAIVAQHQAQRDAGSFSDFIPVPDIDDAGRNQLLANAREDAAHALGLCILMARRQRWMLRIGWGALGLLAYIAWRVS